MNSIKKLIQVVFVVCLFSFLESCEQSEPPELVASNNSGSTVTYSSNLTFSGITWTIKTGYGQKQGPGPNYFSNSSKNVWVDSTTGYLHLKITSDTGKWNCAEIISDDKFGYGTYVFTVASNVAELNKNVVVGFFTWDNTSFYNQANSEVDIEFSKWGSNTDSLTLTYSAQPVQFDNPIPYYERTKHPLMNVSKLKNMSIHAFKWTDTLITWNSYEGAIFPGTNSLASWQFDKTKQPRSKIEGGNSSLPIVVPAPGGDTHARINLWLLNGLGPTDNKAVELIVKEFKFIPL